jgi:hypothetical protein
VIKDLIPKVHGLLNDVKGVFKMGNEHGFFINFYGQISHINWFFFF